MRRFVAITALAAVALLLGLGPAAYAQTNTSLPLAPGQGGPDNGVNAPFAGNSSGASGGADNPAADAGPAVDDGDEDSSIAPWLIGAAVLVLLAAGAGLVARRAKADRRPSYSA